MPVPIPGITIRQHELFKATGLRRSELTTSGLDWRELAAIYEDHTARHDELNDTANFVSAKLRRFPTVHSVRSRIKDAGHLVEKIVRKRLEEPERVIGFHNYQVEVTDRIGIRALHLVKDDWRPIHEFIEREWKLLESPVAYHRAGDHPDWLAAFKTAQCVVKEWSEPLKVDTERAMD